MTASISPDQNTQCFHCALEIAPSIHIHISVLGEKRAMCCAGCASVAEAIVSADLESYYRHRTDKPQQGELLIPEELRALKLYDHPEIQKTFVHNIGEHTQTASLILEGVTCAACVWLNQQHLSKLEGVLSAEINYSTLKAVVTWDERTIQLSDILEAIRLIGYQAHPYDPAQRQHILEKTRKQTLKYLGIAGVFGMQVMGLAISLYFDDGTMDAGIKLLLHRASLILTLPVIFYAARPFFKGATHDLKNRRFGMDTPVSLGISLAFTASVWAVITQTGEIYFDSVCMFTFLLLGARYLEITARKRAADSADIVSQVKPTLARRLNADGQIEILPALELKVGDHALVHAGDTVPADGTIIEGESSLDESILTGESAPKIKTVPASVIGGSINIDSPITIEITRTGGKTVLSGIQRLLDEAQQSKPAIAQFADRIAGGFVLAIISLATVTGIYWFNQSPEHWLAPTIAVLIVSCPCALSLATPASITAAVGRLMKQGVIISNKTALDALHKLDVIFFDKTGTLTEGKLALQTHTLLDLRFKDSHLAICSVIEQHSEHPVAHAFTSHPTKKTAHAVQNIAGKGLIASVDNEIYYLGTAAHIQAQTGFVLDTSVLSKQAQLTQVILANDQNIIAVYGLSDAIKPDSAKLIKWLKQHHIQPIMLTGDNLTTAQKIAADIGIDTVYADQLPADKLAMMKAYQQGQYATNHAQQIVGMVGDGVNDAAVLAGADCAIATQGAAVLASAGSDVLLLTPKLSAIQTAIETAQKTQRIIKQNLIWAVTYNLLAIPAAAMDFVPPWAAAIGMSLSSLLVVLNALRLRRA